MSNRVLTEILEGMTYLMKNSNRNPTRVYLGQTEKKHLSLEFEQYVSKTVHKEDILETIYGLTIYYVEDVHHLYVA